MGRVTSARQLVRAGLHRVQRYDTYEGAPLRERLAHLPRPTLAQRHRTESEASAAAVLVLIDAAAYIIG